MSEPYLLAAGLLTAGPISVPPPPPLPPNLSNTLSALLASITAQTIPSANDYKAVPGIETEITLPEFSQTQFVDKQGEQAENSAPIEIQKENSSSPSSLPLLPSAQGTSKPGSNLQPLFKPQSTILSPTSGSQLYQQRVAALRAGRLYTRLPADTFQSVWAKGLLPHPTHEQWKRLLEQEAKAVAKGQGSNRLSILVGDSLSMWFPSERLPGSQLWLNQGISGENSGQILKRLSAFSQTRPDTIYVMAGTNDLRQGASDRVILTNIRQIMRRLRLNHPQAQVIVQSIIPTRLPAISNERIRNLNQQIAIIAQQERVAYLNLHTLLADENGHLGQDFTTDGIHLSRQGYEVWQEALQYAEWAIASSRTN